MDIRIKNIARSMENFIKTLDDIPSCNLDKFDSKDTLVVMIDMINGFCKFGPLSSPNVEKLIPKMSDFLDESICKGFPILAYQDFHSSNKSAEFEFYPPHCIGGSNECEIVLELKRDELNIVRKNSTNGFLAFNPLETYKNVRNFLVIGCVTDICIKDFSTTMSKYLQEKDIDGKVYVIENLVSTFHIEEVHDKDAEHILALYQMQKSGVSFLRY